MPARIVAGYYVRLRAWAVMPDHCRLVVLVLAGHRKYLPCQIILIYTFVSQDVSYLEIINIGVKAPGPYTEFMEQTDSSIAAVSGQPSSVRTAVVLMFVSLGLGFVRTILEWDSVVERAAPIGGALVVVVVQAVVIVFFTWVTLMIARGRNWARVLYTVFFVIGLPFVGLGMLKLLPVAPVSAMLGILQAVLQVVAVIFLFRAGSRGWFKKKA